MSYEKRHKALGDAFGRLIRSYGAPLGMVLVVMLAALYLFAGRGVTVSPEFPRKASDFMQAARAERRLAELAKVLESSPEDIQALAEAGRLKFQLGAPRYIEAIADLERARALGHSDVRSFYYLGVMYQAVGLYDFAAQEYRRFLNNHPQDAEVRMLLAKLSYASGDYAGAAKEYDLLLKAGAGDPVLLENLLLARWKNKQDHSDALARLRALGPQGSFLGDYAEGRIKYEEKDFAGALPLLKKAVDAAPTAGGVADAPGLYWMAADAAYRGKDPDSAHAWLAELLKLSPEHGEGKALLARIEKARAAAARKKKK
ncbi:MAG: tetratricopeptide repeat protein [Elusimicrobiales bacterium]